MKKLIINISQLVKLPINLETMSLIPHCHFQELLIDLQKLAAKIEQLSSNKTNFTYESISQWQQTHAAQKQKLYCNHRLRNNNDCNPS